MPRARIAPARQCIWLVSSLQPSGERPSRVRQHPDYIHWATSMTPKFAWRGARPRPVMRVELMDMSMSLRLSVCCGKSGSPNGVLGDIDLVASPLQHNPGTHLGNRHQLFRSLLVGSIPHLPHIRELSKRATAITKARDRLCGDLGCTVAPWCVMGYLMLHVSASSQGCVKRGYVAGSSMSPAFLLAFAGGLSRRSPDFSCAASQTQSSLPLVASLQCASVRIGAIPSRTGQIESM